MRRFSLAVLAVAALAGFLASMQWASADELRDLYRGAREAAMGGASTAITWGDEAIYLNPAAMAGNQGADFYLLNADLGTSSDTVTEIKNSSSAFSNVDTSTLEKLLGKNIYGEATLSPAITLPNFGMSVLVDEQFALLAQNLANPNVLLGLQTTSGFQFAFGFSLLPGRHNDDDLRVGVGYKIMFRRGGYRTLSMDQIFNISEAEVKSIVGNFGEGMSGDLGLQYIHKMSRRSQFMAGLDYAQIGGMTFAGGGDTQPQDLGIGIGTKFLLDPGMALTIGYDLKNLTQDVEFARRNHLGFDFQLANMDFYGGLNEGRYLSGGASLDLWLIQVTALTYEDELGEYVGQMGERRYMLRVTLKFAGL